MAANQPSSTPPALQQRLNCIWDDFKCYAEESQANWQVPGMAIAVVSGDSDKPIYTLFSGVKRLGGGDPIDGQTVFQIGSASKAFTAALLAILVDEEKVNWTDRVVDHIPGFEMYDPWVTREFQVRDLMAQHSGMQPNAGDMMAYIGMSRDYIESKIRFMKPFSSFRADLGGNRGGKDFRSARYGIEHRHVRFLPQGSKCSVSAQVDQWQGDRLRN